MAEKISPSVRKVVGDALEQAIDKWVSNNLLTAWTILSTPDWETLDNIGPAEPILREADIQKVGECVLAAEAEIKLLVNRIRSMTEDKNDDS